MNKKFDIIISNISFIVCRKSDENWHRINLVNEKNYLLIYSLDGQAEYEASGNHFSVSKGDMLFFDKGQAHTSYSNKEHPWTYCTIAFDAQNLASNEFPILTHITNTEFCRQLYKTLNYEWNAKKSGYLLMCRGLVSELLCILIRENSLEHKKGAVIENIKRHMVENFTCDFTVDKLSKMAGMSVPHFHRLFKENTDLSVKKYLNTVRINRACDLLKSGEHNITEIAYIVGFHDIYYFSRLFKKMVGTSPSSFVSKTTSS